MKIFYSFAIWVMFLNLCDSRVWCETNQTCWTNLSEHYTCNIQKQVCQHESLLSASKQYIIGGILIIFISAFANAGGIGGGSVIVPVLTIMFAFEVNEAIPLSKATIFAGAVINVFFLLNARKVENPNQSLIDYKLCSFMLPIMMCGTFCGVYLNFIFPPMVIIVLLTGYLLISIFSIKKKFKILSDKEDRELGITLKDQIFDSYKKVKEEMSKQYDNFFNRNAASNNDEIPVHTADHLKDALPVEEDRNEQKAEDKPRLQQDDVETAAGSSGDFKSRLKVPVTSGQPVKNSLLTSFGPNSKHRKKKSFGEMICDNIVFILILLLSIFTIVVLSLFKEGILIDLGVKINRCSVLGLSVMGIILVFCLTVSAIAFTFNIQKEKRDLNQSIITGENLPVKVQNDLNTLRIQQERSERELSELDRHNDSGDTDYLSFHSNEIKEQFSVDGDIHIQNEREETQVSLSIDKQVATTVHLSKKSRRFDDARSIKSELSIESIIDEEMQQKKKTLVKLGLMSFIAGTGAGLLGIGGGMIINPFLIILNYSPLDSMAISSMGVLFTSTISTSEFLIMKAIHFSDLTFFLVLAGIGSLTGVFLIKSLIEKYRRQSILLIIILGIFIFAVIVLPLFGLLTIPISNYFKFGTVCD